MLKTKEERMQFIHDFVDRELAAIEASGRPVTTEDGEAIAKAAAAALRGAVTATNKPGPRPQA